MKQLITSLLFCALALAGNAQVQEISSMGDIKYHNRPMIIEAYATWCQPCRVYQPIFERVAEEYKGRVDFYRMDADCPDAHDTVEINSVPTTIFLWDPKGDATVKYSVEAGLMSYDELKQYVELTISKQFH